MLGENGAGKSTLMRVLGGEFIPTRGTVKVGDEEQHFRGPMDAMSKGIAVIHQEMALATDLTVAENIFMWMLPSVISWPELNKRAKELITSLGFPFHQVLLLAISRSHINRSLKSPKLCRAMRK